MQVPPPAHLYGHPEAQTPDFFLALTSGEMQNDMPPLLCPRDSVVVAYCRQRRIRNVQKVAVPSHAASDVDPHALLRPGPGRLRTSFQRLSRWLKIPFTCDRSRHPEGLGVGNCTSWSVTPYPNPQNGFLRFLMIPAFPLESGLLRSSVTSLIA